MDYFALNCLLLQLLRMSKSTRELGWLQQGTAVGARGELPYPVRVARPYVYINPSCHTSNRKDYKGWDIWS